MPADPDQLERLLDREHACLVTGRLGRLTRLLAEKEVLIASGVLGAAGPQELSRLRAKAERNTQLLLATSEGIESVRRRLAPDGTPVCTYSDVGLRIDLGTGRRTIARRA